MIDIFRSVNRRIAVTGLLLIAATIASCTESPSPGAGLVERAGASMGTELALTAWTSDEAGAVTAFETVFEEFDRLEKLMSSWLEDSDIQRLNAAAGKGPVTVGAEVLRVLGIARQVSEWTEGKFDVTFGVMSGLWNFDYQNRDDAIPDPDELALRLPLVNYRDLSLDEQTGTAFLSREGMLASLGGIGKGYAVDQAADILRRKGFKDFMIQFGGDLYVAGQPGDRQWRLGIRDPRGPADGIFAAVDLSESTFSTSGDYERFFIKDGRRYHHIIDPATGEPAQGTRSVTIATRSAAVADGLSTGVFILGPEAGMALIERLPGVEGVIVSADNEVLVSPGLDGRLIMLAPLTDAL
jgi:thiamine biosynthesis lipoprotein